MLLAGCAHEKPFSTGDFGLDTTLTRGSDRQLTFNLGTDRGPAWRTDGSGLFYMFEDISASPRDRCLGELPPTGGTVRNIVCPTTVESLDSLDTFFEPAPGPGGQFLYLREASPPDGITAINSALVLASETDPLDAVTIQQYPHTASNGKIHQGISNIRWLSSTKVVYLAEKVLYLSPCGPCPIDTVRTGIELVQVDLSGTSPLTTIIPNTEETSSVFPGSNEDLIILTKNGDSRVYEMTLSTGATSILHDFGPGQIVRDVSVSGNRLYAIVGGRVSFVVDPTLGSVQQDESGQLVTVDLSNGSAAPIFVTERFFRRPAVSPLGDHMVAEAYTAIIIQGAGGSADTTISKVADLWLFDIP